MNNSSIFEAIVLNIPNSSLIDSNMGYYGVSYKISANDENFSVMNMFIRIVAKIYLKSCYDLKKKFKKKKINKERIKKVYKVRKEKKKEKKRKKNIKKKNQKNLKKLKNKKIK
jgi:ribosomal protein S2